MDQISKITSRDNDHVKLARRVRDGREPGVMFLEGRRLIEEAARSGITPDLAFVTRDAVESGMLAGLSAKSTFEVPPSVLEIGVGSGAVLLAVARMYGPGRYVGVDISRLAVETAKENAARNGIDVEIRESDLFAAVQGEHFDAILFNAPLYDREPRYAIEENMLCDPGGKILERFVRDVSHFLKPGGAAYVTASNIGLVAPLDNPRVAISLRGAELFEFGAIRTLVKIVPNHS